MNLKKLFSIIVVSGTILNASHALAQLKVGSNPATITPNANLDVESTGGERTVILQNGNMGVNQAAPSNKLHVTSASDPLRLEGLQAAPSPSSNFLVVDGNGVVKTQAPTAVPGSTIVVASMSALTLASAGAVAGGNIIAVPYDLPELNVGGAWNPTTFEFTAPADGFYEFSASVMLYDGSSSAVTITRIGVSKPNAAKPGGNDALAAVAYMNFPKGGAVPTVVKVIGINKMLAGQKAFIQGRYFYGTFGAAGAISYDTAANNKLQIKYLGQ